MYCKISIMFLLIAGLNFLSPLFLYSINFKNMLVENSIMFLALGAFSMLLSIIFFILHIKDELKNGNAC